MRAALDRLYTTAAWLAAAMMVGTLLMVLLGIATRLFSWFVPGTDAYAGYCMAAADAETRGWKLSQEKNGWYIDQLKQKGMSIVKPSPQLAADLKKVGDTMLQEWLKKAGPDGQAAVDAFRKM